MDFTNVRLGRDTLKNISNKYDYNVIHGNNNAIGFKSLEKNIKGFQNTAIGSLSLNNNKEAHNNTSVGFKSLFYSTEKYNTAFGALTGKSLVNGKSNILIGKEADVSTSDAFNQIVIGTNAIGLDNNSVTLGNIDTEDIYMSQGKSAIVHCGGLNLYNLHGEFSYCFPSTDGKKNNILKTDGMGNLRWFNDNSTSSSLNDLTDCSANLSNKNIFIGKKLDMNNTNCGKNIVLGYSESCNISTGSNNICIGNSADVSSNNAYNQIVFGNDTIGVNNNSVTLGNTKITDVYMGQDSGAKVNCSGLRPNLVEATNDSEAAAAGVAIGELYNNTGTVKVRLI